METNTNCPNLSGQGTIDYATGWSTTGGIASQGGQLMVNKPGTCVSNRPSGPWPASSALSGGSDGTNWLGGHSGEDWQNKLQAPLPAGTYTFFLDAGNVIFSPWVATSTTLSFYGLKPGDANFSKIPSQLIGSVVVSNVLSASNQTWVTRSFTVTTTEIFTRIEIVNSGNSAYTYIDNFKLSYTVDAGEDQSVCFGQTATVTGTGSGTWSPQAGNPGTATITSPNSASTTITDFSAAGVYTFVRTFNGCTDLVTVTVVGGGPGVISASLTQPNCQVPTGSATITSLGALLYAFDGAAYQAGNSISNLVPGTHFVYTSTAGSAGQVTSCNQAGPFVFTINAVPSPPVTPIIIAVNPTCEVLTGSVIVSSPVSGVTYSLAGAATAVNSSGLFTGLAAGSGPYTVTASMSGCNSSVSNSVNIGVRIISVPGTISASLVQPNCSVLTGSATITSLGAVLYAFDGAAYQASNSISNLAPGSHFVYTTTATSAGQINSCNQMGPFVFTINTAPPIPVTPVITVVNPTCTVLTGSVIVSSPVSGVSYSLAGTATAVNTNGSFTGLVASSGPYTVRASIGNSSVSNSVNIGTPATGCIEPCEADAGTVILIP